MEIGNCLSVANISFSMSYLLDLNALVEQLNGGFIQQCCFTRPRVSSLTNSLSLGGLL